MGRIELLPWSDDDLWAVERFLGDPEVMLHLGGPQRRFLHAFPAITNGPSNALCRKLGFANLGQCEFEYSAGHPLQCNDWCLDLALTPDQPELVAEPFPTDHRSDP